MSTTVELCPPRKIKSKPESKWLAYYSTYIFEDFNNECMFQLNFPAELKVADTINFVQGIIFVVWSNIGTLQSTS